MPQISRTVLLVDDSAADRELYRRHLRRDSEYSYTFVEAELGHQGLALCHQHQPDLVLLDYRLPDLDGLEFLSQLSTVKPFPHLPVIVVTGQGSEAIAVKAMKAGAQDYLVKEHITPESLQWVVNHTIESVQLRLQVQQGIERERIVSQIIRKVNQTLDLDEILQTTVTEVRQYLRTDRVLIFRLQSDGSGTVVTESVGSGWTPPLSASYYDPCLSSDYLEPFRQGKVASKSDIHDGGIDPCHVELLDNLQVQANLVVPIRQNSQLWGLLIAHHCTAPRQWQAAEIDLLQDLTTQIGTALKQAELYQQTQDELVERKRVEEALRRSQERLSSALEASRMGTWDWDICTGKIEWSPNLESMFGMAAGEFDGSFEMFASRLHPEDYDFVLAAVDRAVATGEDYAVELRVVLPDGTIRWTLSQGKVFYDSQGQPVRMAGNDLDISERKRAAEVLRESEERFRQLAENINTVFWVREAQTGQISYISPAYERLWGLNPQELYATPETWPGYIHPEDRKRSNRAFAQKAASGQFDEKYRIVLPDGCIRWVRDRCFPLLDDAGQVYRFTGIAEDITDATLAEQRLMASEQRLQMALKGSGGGLWNWNIVTNEHYLSPRWLEMLGYESGELPSHYTSWEDLIHPDDQGWVLERLQAHIQDESVPYQFDYRMLSKSGKWKWIANFGQVVQRDEQGRPLQMAGIHFDVSDRKQAEADLRTSEERFRASVENMLDCFAIYRAVRNDQGQIIDFAAEYINDAACTTSRMSREEHLSQHLCKLLPTHRSSGLFDEYCQVVETGQPLFKENVIYEDQFGQQQLTKAFDIRVAKYDDGYVATWRDITQRKCTENSLRESEQMLRLATEGATLGMWSWDLQQGNLVWTDLCKALFGLSAETEMSYSIFLDALHPEDRELANIAVTRCLQGEGEYNIEFRSVWPDGTVRWMAAQGNCLRDDNDQPIRMMGIALDITERKQREAEREQLLERERSARQDAERANRVKDEFLAVLSHELRSPLNPILGWSSLLQTRSFTPDKTAAALATIERNAKLQTQLIDDLLDVARILRGKLKLETVPLDPVFAIESAIDTVRAAAVAKSILLHSVLPKIGQVSGDNTRLQQIVWNLLSNAIKFTPDHGRVDIRLERADDQARIIVSDSGRGIKPDFLPHLFDSFRQEDASTTRRHGGLGLGLSIVRYLVEAHGGTIWAFSRGEGQGATFTVELPLLNATSELDPLPNEIRDELDLTGLRVLTVDDDPDACDLITTLLAEYGAEVLTMQSAAAALENFETFQPNVLVSDIGMPDMDGYMLLQQVRALSPEEGGQIPAIAVTAYAREEDRCDALDNGFQRHIAKPLDPKILVSAILELTRR
jgi:PAS domain S-box-containing protein